MEESSKFDLKMELKSIGMSLSDFAKEIHLTPNTVSRWSRGEINIPKWVEPFLINYKKAKKLDELANEAYKFNKL